MVRIGDEIVTPPLNGAILAGITRDSVLTLLRDWGHKVSERPVSIDEVIPAAKAGTLEMWGTGTAALQHACRHPVRLCARPAWLDPAAGQPHRRPRVDRRCAGLRESL